MLKSAAPARSNDGSPFDRPALQLVVLAVAGLVLRWSTFGDPNLAADEGFYHAVGLAMHHGALPYVDVWDRKPLGLFLIYWAIAGITPDPLAYQLAAWACAVATAAVIGAIARRWTGPQGALLAGLVYLVWLTPLYGFGGQSPVFYNLPVAAAALLLCQGLPQVARGERSGRVALAMLLAGAAITVKTTVLFEALFFGLAALAAAWRSRRPVAWVALRGLGWLALGLAPTAAIALGYAALGHWPEYWHAMVGANLAKGTDWGGTAIRLILLWRLLLPLILATAGGLMLQGPRGRGFVEGWLIAALFGLAAVPNFYPHYALPLLVVLCLAAAPLLDRGWIGLVAAAAMIALGLRAEPPFRPGQADRSRAAFAALSAAIRAHDGGRPLLVYAGPAQLYGMTGHAFPTPLAFETHLSQQAERNVSHLDTVAELRRVLAARPGAVVLPVQVRNGPAIPETWALVNTYVRQHCRPVARRHVEDWLLADDLVVWGDCHEPTVSGAR
ncbi:hypothetical protein ACFOON_04990 [Novosphingobium piscinae]|uniref:hypothetical protein n=1 Tax=Novosphingobium piscinae TaxID=1507448 RepID=UPI00361F2028